MAHPHAEALPLGLQNDQDRLLASLAVTISALQSRVAALERLPTVQTGSGPPPAGVMRDGTLYLDTTNSRLYARTAGTNKSTLLS